MIKDPGLLWSREKMRQSITVQGLEKDYKKSKENFMAKLQMGTKEIAPFSFPGLIDCPLQPGNLKISEKACLKRYRYAQARNVENSNGEDIFNFFVNQGLLKCQRCPIAKAMASNSDSADETQVFLKRPGHFNLKRRKRLSYEIDHDI